MSRGHREQNRLSWNEATRAHNSHKGDQGAFLRRRGTSTLFPEELALLGAVRGKALLHLQCNAGQDTLSLAKRGAKVTGVDISDEAISFARQLSVDAHLPATFVRSDVFAYLRRPPKFDLVFCSYGVVGWLDDLRAWARGVARALRPGGAFVYVDFHPAAWVFDERGRPANAPSVTTSRAAATASCRGASKRACATFRTPTAPRSSPGASARSSRRCSTPG